MMKDQELEHRKLSLFLDLNLQQIWLKVARTNERASNEPKQEEVQMNPAKMTLHADGGVRGFEIEERGGAKGGFMIEDWSGFLLFHFEPIFTGPQKTG